MRNMIISVRHTGIPHKVEHNNFTSFIFSVTGEMADEARASFPKYTDHYGVVMGWTRCCLSLLLLYSMALAKCLRRTHSSNGKFSSLY